jgi:predicted RNA-binding protein (TIGR00451 family)
LRIYNVSKTERDEIFSKFSKNIPIPKSKDLRIAEVEGRSLQIIFDDDLRLYLGRKGDLLFPLLKDEVLLPNLPTATVDSGAVKFVCNGANVMRPGILTFDGDFQKSDPICVKEAKFGKTIAVGLALGGRAELEQLKRGPAIENIHYVGDKLWNALKELSL